MFCNDSVDKTVSERLLCGHKVISVGVLFDLLDGLSGVFGKDLVELCTYRMTTPGVGREVGATLGNSRDIFMGLFHAPHVVGEALKTAVFAASVYTVVDSFLRSPILSILNIYSGPTKSDVTDTTLGIGKLVEGTYQLTKYGINAAMAVIFTIVIALVLVVILGILSKVVFYYDE